MKVPDNPKTYQGNQVLINSDRLVFNAKKDSILLYSEEHIGFSTKGNFHFDTDTSNDTKFIVNAPNIYLGLKNSTTNNLPTEPAVLGDKLVALFEQLCGLLDMVNNDVCFNIAHITTAAGTPSGMNPNNKPINVCIKEEVDMIRKSLKGVLSEKTKLI